MRKLFLLVATLLVLCGQLHAQEQSGANLLPRSLRVLTYEEQKQLTPKRIVELLGEGNRRFVADDLTERVHSKQVRAAVSGQFPKAVVLSCLDSRIPVEDVFDCGIGDLFVARVAGNFSNTDIVGSMEFACKVVGSKVVLVLGHSDCGAVKGAIDGVELGNLTQVLNNIKPAIRRADDFKGEKTSSNKKYLEMVTEQNVRYTLERIRSTSPILREMEASGRIQIVGGVYNMETGAVKFLD